MSAPHKFDLVYTGSGPASQRSAISSAKMGKRIAVVEWRRFFGVHAIGTGATKVIHIGQAMLDLDGGTNHFLRTVFNYPTLTECYKVAALDASLHCRRTTGASGLNAGRSGEFQVCQCLKQPRVEGVFLLLSVLALCLLFSGCTSVDTILLTSDRFPPKESADEVAVLEAKPTRPHRELAELRIGDSWLSFGSLQRKILNQAATLGADAVIFAKPQTVTLHEVAYQPMYDSWGYDSPYYGTPWGYGGYGGPFGSWGPWGGSYSGSVAVPYDEVTRMFMGTAIRYTEATDFDDRTQSGEAWLPRKEPITKDSSDGGADEPVEK